MSNETRKFLPRILGMRNPESSELTHLAARKCSTNKARNVRFAKNKAARPESMLECSLNKPPNASRFVMHFVNNPRL